MYFRLSASWTSRTVSTSFTNGNALSVSIGNGVGSCVGSISTPPLVVVTSNAPQNTQKSSFFAVWGVSTTQAPATQAPATQSPGTQTPGTQTPATQTPATQTPGTQTPGTQTPATQTPGTQTPGTQTPGTQTPTSNPS